MVEPIKPLLKGGRTPRQKGKRFEREIAGTYRSTGLDPTAQAMPMSGGMEFHKGDILKRHDHEFVDECKHIEKINIWKCWAQTESQAHGQQRPVLHIKRNYGLPVSVIRTSDYFDLRLEVKQLREENERLHNGK